MMTARIKLRLQRLEYAAPPLVPPGPSLADEIDRLTAVYEASDRAHLAEVAAALTCDDPDRRTWATRESARLAAFATMSTRQWLATEWPRMKSVMLEGRVTHA